MALGFLDLPPEIINTILSRLHPRDIIHARTACKQLHNSVVASSLLQYILECYANGVADDLRPGLAYSERLDHLRRREAAWRSLKPVDTYTVPVPFTTGGLYDFTDGMFVLNVRGSARQEYASVRLPGIDDTSSPVWNRFALGADGLLIDFCLSVSTYNLIVLITA
jgi:hypothetical protein